MPAAGSTAPRFPTDSGKGDVSVRSRCRRRRSAASGQLRLMTVRSEGQFNTVVYEEEDIYRGQERRDVILISPEDMRAPAAGAGSARDGAQPGRRAGGQLVRPFDIRPGNAAMYYPEANVLVPRDVDPRSKTPAFKSVLVEIVREPARPNHVSVSGRNHPPS